MATTDQDSYLPDPVMPKCPAQQWLAGQTALVSGASSVLPRSSRVNPSLTIYAWSLRVADLLARARAAQSPAAAGADPHGHAANLILR
jgi:hypothetical protein